MTAVSTDRSVRSLLRQGVQQLRTAAVPSFTLAAELLLLHVAGRDRTWLYAHSEEILSAELAEKYFALLRRRSLGEPTQHLTGKQEFWGLEFEVTPDVLIPRPETEHLIEVAIDRLAVRELRAGRTNRLESQPLAIADIGTGSGCIAIALAKELPSAMIYAADLSKAALDVARRNAARLGFSDRIYFLESDLMEKFSSPFGLSPLEMIISNPPYVGLHEAGSLPVEVRKHEPPAALYGGQEGYELYAAFMPQAADFLKPGGLLVLELGHNSLPAVQPLLDTPAWTNIRVTNDLAGIPRVISAEKA